MRDFSFEFAFITDPQIGMNSPNGLDGPDSDRSRLEALLANHNAEGLLRGAGSRLRGIQVPAGRGGDRGWDTHTDNFEGTPRHVSVVDQSMSALLADLQTKRLVDQTPVVLGAEFGRTSRSNDNGGWDHIQRQVLGDAE